MALRTAVRKRNAVRGFRALVFVLLAVYLIGSSKLEVFHQFLHAHEYVVSHSDVAESDPCHRTIYHFDFENGCGHSAHMVVTDKCELCDVIFYADQLLLTVHEVGVADTQSVDVVLAAVDIIALGRPSAPSRAPPALI